MIKYSEKIVIRTNEDNTLEVPAENFKVENYIGNTITIVCKKYILEIDGNEISFLNENTRTDFLERINNFCVNGTSKSFNTNELSVINLWHVSKAVGDYHEGLASIKKNSKWGFIDKEDKEIISHKYDTVYSFQEGKIGVCLYNKWGVIDKEGKEIIPCLYDNVQIYNNIIVVRDRMKVILLTKEGTLLTQTFIIESLEDLKKLPLNVSILSMKEKFALKYDQDNVWFDTLKEQENFIQEINVDSDFSLKKVNSL